MRWIVISLVLISCLGLAVFPACAEGLVVPGDIDGDKIVSAEELAAAEKEAKDGKISADDLQEIKRIHEKYPIVVTNSYGDTVTIYKPVKRIISTPSWSYETLFILGALDKVVGVTSTAKETYHWVPGMDSKPTVGAWNSIDYEKIIELKPDIVNTNKDVKDKMEMAGIAFLRISTRNWTTFETDLRCLAKVLEKDDRAEAFIKWNDDYRNRLAEIIDKIPPEDRLRVYGESNHHHLSAAAPASGLHCAITMAGGINIGGELNVQSTYLDVDPEWIMTENPQAIVIAATMGDWPPGIALDYSTPENAAESLNQYLKDTISRPGINTTDAAKNGRIYLLQGYCSEGASRGVIAAYYIAKWLYPERFGDIDPNEIHKEYFERWLGAPYSGIWAYPEAS
ncbi:MAG: Cobalamin-binding protein precursor [Methanosaeta sp. PtaU1.Bin112]|nr:MAG: Cobalamin-binding protein precursor [Methanosaeta sp. PtaU1.Bin112]